jgi:Predicted S-adenosylmethionine-dependent methyltransferase involved in bacterial cell division
MTSFLDEEINKISEKSHINLNNKQLDELRTHGRLLETWGRKMNLTGIENPLEIAQRHFLEGILAGEKLRECHAGGPLVDLGSGNGFPAVPMAVVCRQARPLVLVESLEKKAAFLRALIRELNWEEARVEVRHVTRGADLDDLPCRVFTSRGVAISHLLQEGLPFLDSGGWCVLFGARGDLQKDLGKNPGRLVLQDEVQLPSRESAILLLQKT